ncbi:lipoyl(octanoyl) transferase [Saccharicrinis carchari]|uniref:Octanoyltransferase n=1 Tax=Saccharicrinis carchari TaxID=1168039 RepID=A0A521DI84_SACCC|nr:lipoyl(octanoyl) transferase LipB [Saccharicrinis carchari]SMO71419.1 lipoyl(octanoyl) transferase [Saccharicrinis carchari]
MNSTVKFEDLGLVEYKKAWDYQERVFDSTIGTKLFNREHPEDPKPIVHKLLFCEHPHVYTLGRSGAVNNLLINDAFLKQINATYYKSNRGGDITYHGPGQIVGYPIFDLEEMGLTIKKYIYLLEESIINCVADYNLKGDRLEGATGVWLDVGVPGKARKICAIGVKASRYVSMHGFALNVNTDLGYFNHINPCGFVDKGVTSLEKELGQKQNFELVKKNLLARIKSVFQIKLG